MEDKTLLQEVVIDSQKLKTELDVLAEVETLGPDLIKSSPDEYVEALKNPDTSIPLEEIERVKDTSDITDITDVLELPFTEEKN